MSSETDTTALLPDQWQDPGRAERGYAQEAIVGEAEEYAICTQDIQPAGSGLLTPVDLTTFDVVWMRSRRNDMAFWW